MNIDNYILSYFLFYQIGGKQDIKWSSLIHNGPLFPPEYIPHKIPLIYNGKAIILPEEIEEISSIFSKFIDTDHFTNKKFISNFWHDFKKLLKKYNLHNDITDFSLCDFSKIYNHILTHPNQKSPISKELLEKYSYAYVDNKKEQIGNVIVEPPGIYISHNCNNSKFGRIKRRIYPENITLNLSKNAPIPPITQEYLIKLGHTKWGKIIHDNTLIWLA